MILRAVLEPCFELSTVFEAYAAAGYGLGQSSVLSTMSTATADASCQLNFLHGPLDVFCILGCS